MVLTWLQAESEEKEEAETKGEVRADGEGLTNVVCLHISASCGRLNLKDIQREGVLSLCMHHNCCKW